MWGRGRLGRFVIGCDEALPSSDRVEVLEERDEAEDEAEDEEAGREDEEAGREDDWGGDVHVGGGSMSLYHLEAIGFIFGRGGGRA